MLIVRNLGFGCITTMKYELVLEVNNTTTIDQDMMGSMFLFFYDAELDHILHQK